jgi:hypothetical protein
MNADGKYLCKTLKNLVVRVSQSAAGYQKR